MGMSLVSVQHWYEGRRKEMEHCSVGCSLHYSQEMVDRDFWKLPSEQDIVNCYEGSDIKLRSEDIILNVSLL